MRGAATNFLGRMGNENAAFASEIAGLLRDHHASVRGEAAWALCRLGKPGAVFGKAVAALLEDRDGQARRDAIEALGQMGAGTPIWNAVTPSLKDADPVVRDAAIAALRGMGKTAAPAAKDVAGLLDDPDQRVRRAAFSALDQWGNPDGKMDLQACLLAAADKTPAKQLATLRAHLRLWAGDNAAMQRSVTWLGKPDSDPMPREGLSADEARETLAMFLGLWEHAAASAPVREELAHRIGQVANAISTKPDAATAAMLTELAAKLKDQPAFAGEYEAVSAALGR